MEPILILKNTEAISTAKSALDLSVEIFQSVYDAFKGIGITLTLSELNSLISGVRVNGINSDLITNFTVDKLLDAAAPYTLNGVQLQRSKVKEMIVPPDLNTVKAALTEASGYEGVRIGQDIALMTIDADTISKVSNSDTTIESRHTHYTQTDASTQLVSSLLSVCDVLNEHNSAYNNVLILSIKEEERAFSNMYGLQTPNPIKNILPGLVVLGGQFKVNLSYVRAFESSRA